MKDLDQMEMPCMCRCGEWFDLDEGNTSHRDRKTLICDSCFQEEENDNEREQRIDELNSEIEDAAYTIRIATEELIKLNAPYTKEIKI